MKKILYSILIGMVALSACRKDLDPVFSESPDKRLKDTLDAYQHELMSAPYGWNVVVYPKLLGAFSFYMKFTDSNRVQMFSDMNAEAANTMQESSWRLKALQQPSLLFDTYSYIHVLSDPDASVNGGVYGAGLQSDFEFAFDGRSGDTIRLRGRFNHTYAYLVKAKKEEQDAYYQQKVNRAFDHILDMYTFYQRLTTTEASYDVQINPQLHQAAIYWLENGNYKSVATRFYYTATGISLGDPYADSVKLPFTKLENATWANGTINCTADGKAATIRETVLPLKVDKAAPMQWYNSALQAGEYWQSFNGFHVNGVEDAYNIRAASRFYSVAYWPQYDNGIDLMPWIVVNAAGTGLTFNFGIGFDGPPTVDADGFVHFSIYGQIGNPPAPTAGPINTIRKMADAAGFYMVPYGDKQYAMVSAADGKAWIFWNR